MSTKRLAIASGVPLLIGILLIMLPFTSAQSPQEIPLPSESRDTSTLNIQPTSTPIPTAIPSDQHLRLFSPIPGGDVSQFEEDPTIVRSRLVTVQTGLFGLRGGVSSSDVGEVSDRIELNLFEDTSFIATMQQTETKRDSFIWIGVLESQPLSSATFVVHDDIVMGNISLTTSFYEVRWVSGEAHVVHQIRQSVFPEDIVLTLPAPLTDERDLPQSAELDDGSVIDVLVVYTSVARQQAGSQAAMDALITLAETETNQSYANSGINQRVDIVHTAEVTYQETGSFEDHRDYLQDPSDGIMDEVHQLRTTHCADIVMLVVEDNDYCGIAYIMENVTSGFDDYGFAAVQRDCATGYYSFAHEMGHIMGARHDWYADPTNGKPYSYNHGYVNVPGPWRTIMAYNSECTAHGKDCQRLRYWSNPDVALSGVPMGVAEGLTNASDNRTTLNNTAFSVANFRTTSPEVFVVDGKARPGKVYRVSGPSSLQLFFTMPDNLQIDSAVFRNDILYAVDASDNEHRIYSWDGSRASVVYRHTTYVDDLAFDSKGNLYFSESTGSGGDGMIYNLNLRSRIPTPYVRVPLADVNGFWAGMFAFDPTDRLFVATGNHDNARIYEYTRGHFRERFLSPGAIMGFAFIDSNTVYFANLYQTVYRLSDFNSQMKKISTVYEQKFGIPVGLEDVTLGPKIACQ